MHRSRALVALAAVAVAASAVAPPTVDARSSARVLLEGLNSPKGLAINWARDVVISQGAFGPPDPVLVYITRGRDRGQAFPVTDPVNLVDVAISPLDGTGWGLSSDPAVLFHQLADGTIEEVLDLALYQDGDPDPVDQGDLDPPDPTQTNPYGLTIMPNGDALVADAAGNDVIRVTPEGDAWTVARLDVEEIATDHLPFPAPPTILAEAVPTTVTVGPDGAIYVGELKGFPFRPGSSHVWRVEPDAEGALCSVDTPDPACTVYQGGLTAIQDIDFGPGRRLYVYELAAEGVLAFEAGLESGDPGLIPPAVLLEVRRGRQRELAAGELSQPGGVEVAPNGRIYVTDGIFTGGRLLEIR